MIYCLDAVKQMEVHFPYNMIEGLLCEQAKQQTKNLFKKINKTRYLKFLRSIFVFFLFQAATRHLDLSPEAVFPVPTTWKVMHKIKNWIFERKIKVFSIFSIFTSKYFVKHRLNRIFLIKKTFTRIIFWIMTGKKVIWTNYGIFAQKNTKLTVCFQKKRFSGKKEVYDTLRIFLMQNNWKKK